RGEAKAAVRAYEREDRLTVAPDAQSARESAVKLYADGGGLKSPKNHLILADTNRDVRWLNHLVQDARFREGLLTGSPLR
ncbi:hypothetical protein, partial [Acinetobacter baumannii]|uniref:hypothetical protein n=1 Tax=Acinetobacter baumannii TaxID=470 RepID=UPI003D6BD8EB